VLNLKVAAVQQSLVSRKGGFLHADPAWKRLPYCCRN
jgi:hypothetical protein